MAGELGCRPFPREGTGSSQGASGIRWDLATGQGQDGDRPGTALLPWLGVVV